MAGIGWNCKQEINKSRCRVNVDRKGLIIDVGCGSFSLFLRNIAFASKTILFAAILKWQPWGTRLHLPLFMLISPVVGIATVRFIGNRASAVLGSVLLIVGVWVVADAPERPLFGPYSVIANDRMKQYSLYFGDGWKDLEAAMNAAKELNCTRVGLINGPVEEGEYLFWVLKNEDSRLSFTLDDFEVNNLSRRKAANSSLRGIPPDCIICTRLGVEPHYTSNFKGLPFNKVGRWGENSLFVTAHRFTDGQAQFQPVDDVLNLFKSKETEDRTPGDPEL